MTNTTTIFKERFKYFDIFLSKELAFLTGLLLIIWAIAPAMHWAVILFLSFITSMLLAAFIPLELERNGETTMFQTPNILKHIMYAGLFLFAHLSIVGLHTTGINSTYVALSLALCMPAIAIKLALTMIDDQC